MLTARKRREWLPTFAGLSQLASIKRGRIYDFWFKTQKCSGSLNPDCYPSFFRCWRRKGQNSKARREERSGGGHVINIPKRRSLRAPRRLPQLRRACEPPSYRSRLQMSGAIVASEVWRGERALIKNYPKGLSPAMKQVILLLLLLLSISPPAPPPPSHLPAPPAWTGSGVLKTDSERKGPIWK